MKNETLRKAIGYAMRTERLIRRKTLEQVADALNMSKNQISYYENGKTPITIETFKAYCDYLGINYVDLLNLVDTHEDEFIEVEPR